MSSFDATHADPNLPDIDDRLATPGEPYEVIDGKWVYVAPADYPHSSTQARLAAVFAMHTALGFEAVTDMLTRTSLTSDIAPDVSILPSARHPVTGRRQLEHLAFEVVVSETLRHAGVKAAMMIRRGIRRVFAIDVERSRVLEWSRQLDSWSVLASDGAIDDLVFATPVSLRSMLDAAAVRPAVARALIAQREPIIQAALEEQHAAGKAAGQAKSIVALLDHRRIALTADDRDRILAERDDDRLQRWFAIAIVCTSAAELFS